MKNKIKLFSLITVIFLIIILISRVYITGAYYSIRANNGDPVYLYELARWHECYCEDIQRFILWPCSNDHLTGYSFLEKSAEQDYPIALYALGLRLKKGNYVPVPDGGFGPSYPHYGRAQPIRGQKLINKALELGYIPTVTEGAFYRRVYWKW